MTIGEVCNREVVCAEPELNIHEAAALMRQYHVGDIVVTKSSKNGKRTPIGIVTDRDIVVEMLALDCDVKKYTIYDIMSRDLITVNEHEGIFETIEMMREKGVRRVPVIDKHGYLIGIVSMDDLFDLLSAEMAELAKTIKLQQNREARLRP